ncbi:hypothetical protein FK521_29925, partial [Klebsiella pneumoniae]|nr:hypothetical protein [Klebsiella pneumoniae]
MQAKDAFAGELLEQAGLVVSLRLLAAIVIFAAIAPGILMTAPAVAAQLASEWQLKPGQIGWLFSAEHCSIFHQSADRMCDDRHV